MQRYWERTASRAEQRAPQLRQQVQQSAAPGEYDTTSIDTGRGVPWGAGGLDGVEAAGRRGRRNR
jgi:hypothetical protein